MCSTWPIEASRRWATYHVDSPTPEVPGWSVFTQHTATIATAALALVLIGFSQTVGDARMFASRHDYRIRVDNESVAQGMANVGSGVFQGMPVSTSLSASSLADSSGARTQMASIVTGLVVILTLLIFAPLFSDLPETGPRCDHHRRRRVRHDGRRRDEATLAASAVDFWIAFMAIVGVLTAGVLTGVIIGIILSLGWLVYINARPPVRELGRRPGSTTFRALDDFPDYETYDGLLIVRFDGGMYSSPPKCSSIRSASRVESVDPPADRVVIDFESVNFIDSQGSSELDRLVQAAGARGFAPLRPVEDSGFESVLRRDGVIEERLRCSRLHAARRCRECGARQSSSG